MLLDKFTCFLGLIKPILPGKKDFCKTNRFHMSIKAALLLISSAPITTALMGKLNFLCHQNYVATWTEFFALSALCKWQLCCRQFNLIPLELGNFLIQETLTSNLKKKQTNTARIDLAKIKNSNLRINYLVLSRKRGKYFWRYNLSTKINENQVFSCNTV